MKKSVSLALSSGGARGIAHIGVIEELERQGYEIKSIAGTSMGSLVGGIYASGNLKVYRDWMCTLDKKAIFNLVDFTFSTEGLFKGEKIINELKKMVPDVNIEDLPIYFTAIATDIKNREEVVFEKGSLYEAIRASISIPTVFTPSKLDEMILIDGGILNPLPINRIKGGKPDLLIAVDVNAPSAKKPIASQKSSEKKESSFFPFNRKKGPLLSSTTDKGEQLNYYTLLAQSAILMVQQISTMTVKMYPPDILISISSDSCGPFQFYDAEKIIKAGRIATQKALIEFHARNKQPLIS